MGALHGLLDLLFPRKCVFCGRLLQGEETDLCSACRTDAPVFTGPGKSLRFVRGWTAAYFYEAEVRASLLRFKFHGRRSYAAAYGRFLAARIQQTFAGEYDVLTYVPVSRRRRWSRGYDQVWLLAEATARELGKRPVQTLRKVRHNPAQSTLGGADSRRANVLGAYAALETAAVIGKRVLLLDDILTTGATVSECAKVLQLAGAKEILCAALAAHRGQ